MLLRSLGDRLRARRLDLGLRQSDVAKRIGVHRGTLNTWENHHFTPQVRHLPRIVTFLGYDPFVPIPA